MKKPKRRAKAKRKPDYEGYEAYKRTLWNVPLKPGEYETLIKKAVEKYRI